jgi:cell division protein FtsQ
MGKDRIERNIKRKKHRIRVLIFILFICIIAVLLLKSEYFNIKAITVVNNKTVSSDEIKLLSELKGDNIFLFNKKAAKSKILTDTYLDDVTIIRKLPSSIIIDVKEKQIKALIKCQDEFINVDKNGRMVHLVNSFPGTLPLITGINISQFVPNKNISDDGTKQQAIIGALSITDYAECKNLFYSIDVSDPFNIVFKTKNGLDIKPGDWNNLEYKMSVALSIMKDSEVKGQKGCIEVQSDGTAVFKKY